MLTGEEVFHSIIFYTFTSIMMNKEVDICLIIRAHNLKVFVLPLNVAFKGIYMSVKPLFI